MPSPLSRFTAPRPREGRGRVRRRLWAVGMVALVLPVAACEGEASSQASSTTISQADISRIAAAGKSSGSGTGSSGSASSSAGTTGSSAASASGAEQFVVPAAAKAHTHEGAKAFVTFYWETLGKLDAHPQTGVIERFAAPTCQSCKLQAQSAEELVDAKAHVETKNRTMTGYTVRPDSSADSVVVTFKQRDGGSVRVEANGDRRDLPSNDLSVAARADWLNGEWKLGAAGADKN